MSRENLLFAIIGLLLGFIVGFMFASSVSQRPPMASTAGATQNLPADHPPVGGQDGAGGAPMAEVQTTLAKARNEPTNIDAQLKAAQMYYQIQRYDQAIEFLLNANQIDPNNYEVIANLGLVNLDAGHYDVAEKWYRAADLKKPNEVPVLAGICAATLGQAKASAAEAAIQKLEKVAPTAEDLPHFRERLASIKAGGSSKTN
jgi:tetratricopeptide (TPR) repeat protein